MGKTFQMRLFPSPLRIALCLLLDITILNYIAQTPYYLHFHQGYGAPNLVGIGAFLLITFALFLAGYLLTLRGKASGGWLLLAFLVLEFVGYLVHNLSGAFLKDLPLNDPLFFIVSLIGYLNFVASFVYILIIAKYRHALLFQKDHPLHES